MGSANGHEIALPADIADAVERVLGGMVSAAPVPGVGGRGIFRCESAGRMAALKFLSPVEDSFYRDWAPGLASRGVAVPTVWARGQSGHRPWVLLEWLGPVPDGDASGTLARKIGHLASIHETRRPHRQAGLPSRSGELDRRDLDDAETVFDPREGLRFRRWLEKPWPWLEGDSLLSGDPNRTNWGVRDDGTMVLFDWGQAGFGHPAYDLALLAGGLPRVSTLEEIVTLYLARAENGHDEDPGSWLASAITARLTTVVQFLARWRRGELDPAADAGVAMLKGELLDWVGAVRSWTRPA